jgi:glycosyltransferase involved in cell wall biosynthesis
MKISVAICTYNGARYLEEQLASFLAQIRSPNEIIICDDGSYDSTSNILQAFAKQAPFETHIHCNKITLGSTKNFEKAVFLCSGDIIALSDQDDVWHPKKLLQMEQLFLRNPHVGGVFTNADVVDQDLTSFGFSVWDVVDFSKKEQLHVKRGKAFDILLKRPIVTGATLAFRSLWRERLNPFPKCWVHDAWIAFNLSACSTLTIIQENLIRYRQHGNNQIGAMPKSLRCWIGETLEIDKEVYYSSEIERYEAAYNHFSKWFPPIHENMKKLSFKIRHLRARSDLPARRHLRIPAILKELFSGRYSKYSRSWQVAVRDFLLR